MKKTARKFLKRFVANLSVAAFCLVVGLGTPTGARANEADAKKLIKAMSDYMAAQKAISFHYDTISRSSPKTIRSSALASSGKVTLNRPDKIRVTRIGGFADVEFMFDGKTMTLFGKTANVYGQLEVPGTIDHLIDELRKGETRAWRRLIVVGCLRQAHGYRGQRKGPWQRRDRRNRMRSPGLSNERSRLADLDCTGKPSLSLPLCHHQHQGCAGTAIQHHDQGLENRQRGWVREF